MYALEGQVEPCQYFNVVLPEFFIQILQLWLCFQLALVILLSLEKNHRRDTYQDDKCLYYIKLDKIYAYAIYKWKYFKVAEVTDYVSIFLMVTLVFESENGWDKIWQSE